MSSIHTQHQYLAKTLFGHTLCTIIIIFVVVLMVLLSPGSPGAGRPHRPLPSIPPPGQRTTGALSADDSAVRQPSLGSK